MKLVGLMPVRNEAWCLGFTLRVALRWCDEVVVCDHGCTDESRAIMEELAKTSGVVVREDREQEWNEMQQRNMLLTECRLRGATHIALIDADEFATTNLVDGPIREYVGRLHPGTMMELPLYNVRDCGGVARDVFGLHYHSNGVWGNRLVATAFQDSPVLHWAGDRFHHREPFGCGWNRKSPVSQSYGGSLHLWGASERRLRAKHALYRITERLRFPNKPSRDVEYTYDPATNPDSQLAKDLRLAGPWTFAQVKPEWIEPYADLMQYLDIDAEPWQEAEVRLLLETHGREKFSGLDLLGVE